MNVPAHLNMNDARDWFHVQYLLQLMVRYDGCVTKMAEGAGLKREAVTRRIKRHRLTSSLALARRKKLFLSKT